MPGEGAVHVIDNDEAIRESLAFLFGAAKVSVATYDGAEAFLGKLPGVQGGCVITDVRMSGMSGLDLLKQLREMGNQIPVIIITGHADVLLAVEAMKYGASDFFEKPFDDDALLAAVSAALSDNVAASKDRALQAAIAQRIDLLSARERQVLDGLVTGHSNKAIAYDLSISPRTIEIYRANVMTKMEAGSLSELVRMALTAGVLGKATKTP